MSATATGLILDMVGALVLGFVVPRYQVLVVTSHGTPTEVKGWGRHFEKAAWVAIIAGFALQLIDVL